MCLCHERASGLLLALLEEASLFILFIMFAVAVAGVGRVKAYTETTQKFSLSKGTPATATANTLFLSATPFQ